MKYISQFIGLPDPVDADSVLLWNIGLYLPVNLTVTTHKSWIYVYVVCEV